MSKTLQESFDDVTEAWGNLVDEISHVICKAICKVFGHQKPTLGVLDCPCCERCQKVVRPDRTKGCIINYKEPAWIQCLECSRKSYHPKDIAYRYCGHCHKFHPPK